MSTTVHTIPGAGHIVECDDCPWEQHAAFRDQAARAGARHEKRCSARKDRP